MSLIKTCIALFIFLFCKQALSVDQYGLKAPTPPTYEDCTKKEPVRDTDTGYILYYNDVQDVACTERNLRRRQAYVEELEQYQADVTARRQTEANSNNSQPSNNNSNTPPTRSGSNTGAVGSEYERAITESVKFREKYEKLAYFTTSIDVKEATPSGQKAKALRGIGL